MKHLVLAAAIALLSACGRAAAVTASPDPQATGATPVLASEGGILRPIGNGGRIALRDGSATVTFDPYPMTLDGTVRLAIVDGSGAPAAADISLTFESTDMDMGRTTERGRGPSAAQTFPLGLDMPGAWRLVFTVTRAGTVETVTIVLPQVP